MAKRSMLERVPPELAAAALAMFWPLEILRTNLGKVPPGYLPRPFLVILVVALGLAAALGRMAGSRVAGAYVLAAWAMAFWSAAGLAARAQSLGVPAGSGPVAVALVLAGGLAAAPALGRYVRRSKGAEGRLTGLLAIVAAVFFLPSLGRAVQAFLLQPAPPPLVFPDPVGASAAPPAAPGRPDVYLILLDAAARADVLRDLYGEDDAPFRRRLEDLGFRVAAGASSNYVSTQQTVTSMMNLAYLPDTAHLAEVAPHDYRPMQAALVDPPLLRLARAAGYRTRMVGSGAWVWRPEPFDVYRDPGLNSLEHFFLTLSAVGQVAPGLLYEVRRRRLTAALAATPVAADAPPTFTVLHVMAPHPPFAFGADGGPFRDEVPFLFTADKAELLDAVSVEGYYREGFRQQTRHVERVVGDLADRLVAPGARPAVVWIFGDHGPRLLPLRGPQADVAWERTSILHALHVPPGLALEVPADTTLLRTTRALANALFGTDLPDPAARVFLHPTENEYRFTEHPRPGRRGPLPSP